MPKFLKEILTEGEYEVSTFSGPVKKKFTKKDLQASGSTVTKMLKAGIKIPAPFRHVEKGAFVKPVEEATSSPAPENNAGFWEKFFVRKNEHGTYSLYGVVDAPGSEDDPNSPAYKVSRTIKDTSIGFLPGFIDGKGRNWGEHAIVHVALPLDPIEPGQSNFLPLPEDAPDDHFEAIAMSRKVTGNVTQVLTLLRDRGIDLPADTTNENFLDRLLVALMQINKGGSNPLGSKPNSGKVESYPIMMSLTKKQVDAILASSLQNPETGKPFTADDLKDVPSEAEQFKKAAEMMSVQLNSIYRERYKDRIAALVSSGRVDQTYADQSLIPLVNAVQMSFQDGKASENHLDLTLKALEALPAKQSQGGTGSLDTANFMGRTPAGSSKETQPDDQGKGVNDDDIINAILKSVPASY